MNECIKHIKNVLFWSLTLISSLIITHGQANTLNNIWMKGISEELSEDFDILKNEELGMEYVDKLYSTFKYTSNIIDANKTVHEMAMKLEAKINDVFLTLVRAKLAIENMQTLDNTTKSRSSLIPCVEDKTLDLKSKLSKICGNLIDMILTPQDPLHVDYILQRLKTKNWIRQQYFISSWEMESYPHSPFKNCHEIDHMLLWKNYLIRNYYSSRNIIILMDHGGSLSKHHLHIVKSVAKAVIENLNENDKIALLAISNEWSSPQLSDKCLMPNQVPNSVKMLPQLTSVTLNRKKFFLKFIETMSKGSGATNHTLGLQKALKVVQESHLQMNETVMVLYISRGLLSSLTEARVVLKSIMESSSSIPAQLVINTCAVIDETRPTIYETQFMKDVALQNYQKYNITSIHKVLTGSMVAVNSTNDIGFAISNFFTMFNMNKSYDLGRHISLPQWDFKSNVLTVSFSTGCLADEQFGLLVVDVFFNNFAEDIIYFSPNQKHQYAFLMDLEGRVILHPSFASPTTTKQQLSYADISNFEKVPNFANIRFRLLTEPKGSQVSTQFGSKTKYTWRRVGEFYVIAVVTHDLYRVPVRPYQITWPLNVSDSNSIRLIFQQMSPLEVPKACRHLNQVATLDAGSLYLSSSCFQSPSSRQDLNKDEINKYMAYLQDNTGLLNNPGLKREIKDEVAASAHVLNFLRSQHLSSVKSKYIVRRYVASYSGVLELFPGSILDQGLDPTKRPWFVQASQHKHKIVFTPPYLDEGGAGYIVTFAYATTDLVVAVDVTYGYIFRMLLKRMPFCISSNITCFLMDDRGYLVYHPNLIDPNGHGPVEKQHIIHKESLVASDILNNNDFIQKNLCNSYGGQTIQRFYKVNTSFAQVLSNSVSVQGEHCVNYHIAGVSNSNMFIGMVNATCNVVLTFCPCSIIDRLCLNCNRMEQKECECPCECPLEPEGCSWDGSDTPLCNWFPEQTAPLPHFQEEPDTDLKACFPASCSAEKSHYRCLGVAGCEWCKFDVDGGVLNNPFCASMATCFNGIVGSLTPYKILPPGDQKSSSFSIPAGFIGIFLMGVLLVLCMFYIYHRSTSQPAERLYLSSTQDNQLRMSDLNLSDNYHAVANHRDKLLKDEKSDPVSPYCVPSGYRRTVLPADSDHGYSTMTQQDDSEHLSLAPVELESLKDDLDDVSSIGVDRGRTAAELNDKFTCLPINNCVVVVPVTVHRNMEAT